MLRKFKKWFTNGKIAEETGMTHSLLSLSERTQLTRQDIFFEENTILTASIGQEQDIDDILKIEAACYNGKTPWNRRALEHEIKRNKNALYILLRDAGKAVAFIGAWLVEDEAHITNIAVIPTYRQHGLATFLIEELKRISQMEGMRVLSLEVRVSNTTARSLYHTLGFRNGSIKKGYYADDHEDALEMTMFI